MHAISETECKLPTPVEWRGARAQYLAHIQWPGAHYWVGPSKKGPPANRGRNAAKRARRLHGVCADES